jgi:hypothetical protein
MGGGEGGTPKIQIIPIGRAIKMKKIPIKLNK